MLDAIHGVPRNLKPSFIFGALLVDAAGAIANEAAYRLRACAQPKRRGRTVRPGTDTPLWNAVRKQLKPHLSRYGDQAKLGRMLGLPRQRINDFVTGGGKMPDAERTLQLIVWLIALRRQQNRQSQVSSKGAAG